MQGQLADWEDRLTVAEPGPGVRSEPETRDVKSGADEIAVDVSHSRYMAEHIPQARYVELPGSDHLPWIGDVEPVLAEIQELMTGTRPEVEPDRVVVTVMFVDAPHAVAGVQDASARERPAEDGTFFAACNYYAYVAHRAA